LYYNGHQALAFEDILMFRELGWEVFPMGAYFPGQPPRSPFRPALPWSGQDMRWAAHFHADGCSFEEGVEPKPRLTRRFVERFDVVVYVYDVDLIEAEWEVLSKRPVVWRTIGQISPAHEQKAAGLRAHGLRIARWAMTERRAPLYAGDDEVIRCSKDGRMHLPWRDSAMPFILTCSNAFRLRYPGEYAFFDEAVGELPSVVTGDANAGLPRCIGVVDFIRQIGLMQVARGYFYCHGSAIPYTLNFVEAWITGTPVIALARDACVDGCNLEYNEVSDLVEHGSTGFLVRTPAEGADACRMLLQDAGLAGAVAAASRARAEVVFGRETISEQWSGFLNRVA
jgi:hypothetical protein